MPQIAQIFTGESGKPNRRKLFNVGLWGPSKGYFYNIFAFRLLKWLKISLKRHAWHIEVYSLMLTYLDHIWAMFWPNQGHVLAISTI